MITEQEIKAFVNGVSHYFDTVSTDEVAVGSPYLIEPLQAPVNEFMGVITVSGSKGGNVYFSAPKAMLRHLLMSLGEQQITPELIEDVVGEVANTISGNVREFFGARFNISVPFICEGRVENIDYPRHNKAFAVPIRWKNYTAYLVVCLE